MFRRIVKLNSMKIKTNIFVQMIILQLVKIKLNLIDSTDKFDWMLNEHWNDFHRVKFEKISRLWNLLLFLFESRLFAFGSTWTSRRIDNCDRKNAHQTWSSQLLSSNFFELNHIERDFCFHFEGYHDICLTFLLVLGADLCLPFIDTITKSHFT